MTKSNNECYTEPQRFPYTESKMSTSSTPRASILEMPQILPTIRPVYLGAKQAATRGVSVQPSPVFVGVSPNTYEGSKLPAAHPT